VLCDTTGLEDYPYIRRHSYFKADVVILCYSVVSRKSFDNLREKWLPEVRTRCTSSTYVLAGTNTHLRDDGGTGHYLDREADFDLDAVDWDDHPITSGQGYRMAKSSQCAGFVECSYFTAKGVDELFKAVGPTYVLSILPKLKTMILGYICLRGKPAWKKGSPWPDDLRTSSLSTPVQPR
jgi:GTPase SAR1 family protein